MYLYNNLHGNLALNNSTKTKNLIGQFKWNRYCISNYQQALISIEISKLIINFIESNCDVDSLNEKFVNILFNAALKSLPFSRNSKGGIQRKFKKQIWYRVLMAVCVCVCLCVCVCVCVSVCLYVCVHDNSKNNGSIHLKLEHIVVYENSLDEFDIGHCPIKAKVTA